jgi:hypothetical protein
MKVVPAKPGKVRSCAGGTGAAAVCSAPTEVMTESYAWAHRDQEYIAVLALTGRRGDPRRLEEAGFVFRFPFLGEALAEIYRGEGRKPVGKAVIRHGGGTVGPVGEALRQA